jgi:hypothetical protein
MKNGTIVLLLLLSTGLLYGQSEADSLYKRILLVPYNPQMYISDSDYDIARVSKREMREMRERFRLGLDISLQAVFLTGYDSHSLLRDTTQAAQSEIQAIYDHSKYAYAVPERVLQQLAEEDGQPFYKSVFKKKKPEPAQPEKGLQAPEEKEDPRIKDSDRYLNIQITDAVLLPAMADKYGVDLFLFINQFEIQTDYNDCIDLQNKVYNRKIKVHYSMFNALGQQVGGDLVEALFPSNINEAEEIIGRSFPELSREMLKQVPAKADEE